MGEWVSVEDRLPTDEEMTVVGIDRYEWYYVMYWGLEQDYHHKDKPDYQITGWATPDITREELGNLATYWMLLPEPPDA